MKTLLMFPAVTSLRLSQKAGAVLGGLLLAGLVSITPGRACDTISSVTYVGKTYVEAERAVIIWDKAQHVEHFIRQATVHTGADTMAFLVPTPETPVMSNADPKIYDLVNTVGQPTPVAPVAYVTPWDIFAPYGTEFEQHQAPSYDSNVVPAVFSAPKTLKPTKQSPAILEQDVAGYHVTVLATEDYPAIAAWLQSNGFATSPQVEAWIKSYAARHWKINAFTLIKPRQSDDSDLTTPPLRLSFHIDAPYYPYSEPADHQLPAAAGPNGRILTVSVLSDERVDGALADHHNWPGTAKYAGPASTGLKDPSLWLTYAGLSDTAHAAAPPVHLTTFVDEANPRQGTADLYFSPAKEQTFLRGEQTDTSLPPIERLDWSRPVSLLSGLALMLLVPGAPLYCGCRTLFISRRRQNAEPLVISRGWHAADGLLGFAAVTIGMLAAVPTGLMVIGGIFGLITGYPEGIFEVVIGVPILVVCLAVVHCGHQAHSHWKKRPARRLFSWQRRAVTPPPALSAPKPAAVDPDDTVPVPHIHIDPATSEITEINSTGTPLRRYDRTMAVGSLVGGLVVLIAVTVIFLASGAI